MYKVATIRFNPYNLRSLDKETEITIQEHLSRSYDLFSCDTTTTSDAHTTGGGYHGREREQGLRTLVFKKIKKKTL